MVYTLVCESVNDDGYLRTLPPESFTQAGSACESENLPPAVITGKGWQNCGGPDNFLMINLDRVVTITMLKAAGVGHKFAKEFRVHHGIEEVDMQLYDGVCIVFFLCLHIFFSSYTVTIVALIV